LILCGSLTLASCAIGPNYQRPEIETPDAFRFEDESTVGPESAREFADLPWWEVFRDPALEALIEAGLAANPDLKVATARVEQARQMVAASRAAFYPQVGYQGSAGRQKLPSTFIPNSQARFTSFLGALSVAWEIDVWGRIRRANEAARANLLASQEGRRGVLLSLVSELALRYFELLWLDAELAIASDAIEAFERTFDLFDRKYQGGVGSRLEVERARAALADARARVPELELRLVEVENEMSVLLGRNPSAIERGELLVAQVLPDVPAGLPSQLLERRPDVQRAEQAVVEANAMIGVAMGNFFPRVGLTALYGGTSTQITEIVKGSASIWNIAGEFAGPLFQAGKLVAEYRGQNAIWDETIALYEQTVLVAFAEVSDALTARRMLARERAQREIQVAALEDSVSLSLLRYDQGLASYFEVLDAQQRLFPAQLSLATTRRQQLDAVVQLYRALGGGWELGQDWARPPAPATPPAAAGR